MMKVILVGNFTLDKIWINNEFLGEKLGGGVYYSLLPFLHEGINVRIQCVFNPYLYNAKELWNNKVLLHRNQFSTEITTFRLIYGRNGRKLFVENIAPPIMLTQFDYNEAVYVLNPVMNEISINLIKTIRPNALLVSSDIQGYIREVGENNRVIYKVPPNINDLFKNIDILHIHLDEARSITGKYNIEDITHWLQKRINKSYIILTQDTDPVYIITKEFIKRIEFGPVDVKNTTGAGDYLLSATTLHYLESNDIVSSVEKAVEEVKKWLIKINTSSRPTTPEPPPPNP